MAPAFALPQRFEVTTRFLPFTLRFIRGPCTVYEERLGELGLARRG
jgi:hypothetical protein